MRRLDKSIELLVESYTSSGLINHTGGNSLPSREGVERLLRGLEELLFPGFRGQEGLDHDNLRLLTAERVYRLARDLVRELEKSIAFLLRNEGAGPGCGGPGCAGPGCHATAELVAEDFFEELPRLRSLLALDLEAAFRGDPAARSPEEVIVSYPGFDAVCTHRLAHFFWTRGIPLIPRMMSELVHCRTGIDIHPGAEIGESFFIDHGTGVVIGETTVIGRNVKVYQGVTLGALSVRKDEAGLKRHPSIEDDVTIYANATILGGDTIIGRGSVIGASVWVTSSVPPGTTVYPTS
ncbi:MAG: serine O-acetyltransferase [Treponema sp.]|nr:serine O-acetyltransferase [Treponema sp.]